jgi:F-type H+-transporting ATPase subunit b
MLNIDATFLFVFVSFVVFMLLMKQVYFEPIRQIKAEREQKVAEDRENAQSFYGELESLRTGYENSLKEARLKAQSLIQEHRQKAKKSADEQVSKARGEAHQQIEAQMQEIARAREEAYMQLEADKKNLVETVLGKIFSGGEVKTPATSMEH